jgi:hypothetical protein
LNIIILTGKHEEQMVAGSLEDWPRTLEMHNE